MQQACCSFHQWINSQQDLGILLIYWFEYKYVS